ncbi:MAG: sortase domain-bontaining protein, partial [Candidatus Levyibacteriota bacterium]
MEQYVFKKKNHLPRRVRKITGAVVVLAGFLILLYFFFPLISYQVFFGSQDGLEVPVPKYTVVGRNSFASLLTQGVTQLTTDYTDARNWYPQVRPSNTTTVSSYSLSIPKLKIEDAQVSTIDYDLARHLVQFAGTAIPGQNGTAIIFGHSTLPQWFDPKNYKTIFATLHLIKEGDEIFTRVNGVTYA